jgi:Nickel responsive protein SCO4226-like
MPRYLVERRFPGALAIPVNDAGAQACLRVVEVNAALGVNWLHSYVSEDLETMFCVYDGPDPDAIRQAADRNGLPLDHITQVTVLDPYFYTGAMRPDAVVAPSSD